MTALLTCRTQEGIKRSMQLKDSMRETCLHDLAEAWYNLLRAYQSANPDLAAAVLSTVGRYVNWIDVSLVVNERSVCSSAILLYSICYSAIAHLLYCNWITYPFHAYCQQLRSDDV